MELVRAVTIDDFDALHDLVCGAPFGLTSLQLDRDELLERIERSVFAFTRRSERLSGEPFVLVMEELETGRLIGTASVLARTGGYEPFYGYRVVTTVRSSPALKIRRELTTLQLEKTYDGPSELASLFILPESRGRGRGRLLSLSRFALLTMRRNQFSDYVIAEMRGVSDSKGMSPFWEAVGRHFFGLDFPVADALTTVSKRFIDDLLPSTPIYLDLLPDALRGVIGAVHEETRPALEMLESEGFRKTDMIDIFDGGPVLQSQRDHIDAVRRCRLMRVQQVRADLAPEASLLIVASRRDGFRAVQTPVDVVDESQVILCKRVAEQLKVAESDEVWTMTPHSSLPR